MSGLVEFEISSIRFDDVPETRINRFTHERYEVYRHQPFSADEMRAVNRLFAEAKGRSSRKEGWIDISVGKWTAHVEFDVDRELSAFAMECSGLPPEAALQLIFAILSEANACIFIGLTPAGSHELGGVGAKTMLKNYQRVTTTDELGQFIRAHDCRCC